MEFHLRIRLDTYHHFPGEDQFKARFDSQAASLNAIRGDLETMTATMQNVLDDLDQIKKQAGDYIAGRDAIDTQLRADLAAATAAAGISPAEQAAIDSAFSKAEQAKALLVLPPATGASQPQPI
jgi:hypothetical protein